MIRLLATLLVTRRRVRRTEFAVALLRKDAAMVRRGGDRHLARYLEQMADLIEASP